MASTFMADLIVFLQDAGLGLAYGSNLFKGPMAVVPNGDGPFVSIIKTGGLGSEGTHNAVSEPAYERPTAQIVVRARKYDDAEKLAQQLYDVMWPVQNTTINGTWWRELNVRSEPFDLPLDDKGLPRIAFNIDVVKRTSPQTS